MGKNKNTDSNVIEEKDSDIGYNKPIKKIFKFILGILAGILIAIETVSGAILFCNIWKLAIDKAILNNCNNTSISDDIICCGQTCFDNCNLVSIGAYLFSFLVFYTIISVTIYSFLQLVATWDQ